MSDHLLTPIQVSGIADRLQLSASHQESDRASSAFDRAAYDLHTLAVFPPEAPLADMCLATANYYTQYLSRFNPSYTDVARQIKRHLVALGFEVRS